MNPEDYNAVYDVLTIGAGFILTVALMWISDKLFHRDDDS